jgi:hypothetical protein
VSQGPRAVRYSYHANPHFQQGAGGSSRSHPAKAWTWPRRCPRR